MRFLDDDFDLRQELVGEIILIKQVIQLKQIGESNRGIARKLPISSHSITPKTGNKLRQNMGRKAFVQQLHEHALGANTEMSLEALGSIRAD